MVILPVLINKKPVIVISSAVAILCLLVKTRWIMIAESHSTLRESREASFTKLLNTFCLAILGIYIFLEVWQFL